VTTTILPLLIGLLAPLIVQADGGTVQLHEASGRFVVTLFTTPDPLRAGLIDTSVLVQDRETGRVILDATVNLVFQPAGSGSPSLRTRATHGEAKNRLLQAATLRVPAPGWWTVRVFVSRGSDEAVLATKLMVMPAAPRLAAIWPLLIFPPLAIVLFALHQALGRRGLRSVCRP
jgi:hypothetical protein